MDLECSRLIHQDKKHNTVLSTNTLPDVCRVAGSENLMFVEKETESSEGDQSKK